MPASIDIDAERRIATVLHSGTVTGEDLAVAVDRLYADVRWRPGTGVLWDGTAITGLIVAPGEVAALVAAHRRHAAAAGGTRNALLAVRHDDRLIAELFVTLSRTLPADYRLFTDRAAALAWLGGGA